MQPGKMVYKTFRIKVTNKLSLRSCVEDQTYACFVSKILSITATKVVSGEGPERWGRGVLGQHPAPPGDLCSVLSSCPCQFTS